MQLVRRERVEERWGGNLDGQGGLCWLARKKEGRFVDFSAWGGPGVWWLQRGKRVLCRERAPGCLTALARGRPRRTEFIAEMKRCWTMVDGGQYYCY